MPRWTDRVESLFGLLGWFRVAGYGLRVTGYGVRDAPLKERFALGALRSRSVSSELENFLPQAQRSSSETLIKRSDPKNNQ